MRHKTRDSRHEIRDMSHASVTILLAKPERQALSRLVAIRLHDQVPVVVATLLINTRHTPPGCEVKIPEISTTATSTRMSNVSSRPASRRTATAMTLGCKPSNARNPEGVRLSPRPLGVLYQNGFRHFDIPPTPV